MSSSQPARDSSRLEVDDPQYCRLCGAHLGLANAPTDDNGRPVVYNGASGEFHTVTRCHDCWATDHLDTLRRECMERYNGQLAEVLDQ